MKQIRVSVLLLVLLFLCAAVLPEARAQDVGARFGLGFNAMLHTADGLGLGFRGRASAPLNRDLSVGLDLGLTGYVLGGRRNATYVLDPQLAFIVTFPAAGERAPYFLGGVGAYLPLGDEDVESGGPSLHVGVGRVRALYETTFFYEVNPALIIGKESVYFAIPVRAGVIF